MWKITPLWRIDPRKQGSRYHEAVTHRVIEALGPVEPVRRPLIHRAAKRARHAAPWARNTLGVTGGARLIKGEISEHTAAIAARRSVFAMAVK